MIEFTQKQNEAMDAVASEQYTFILFGGAMGGGKTFWGLSALLIMCEIFPRSRWCVIREDLEKIRTTTIPSFKKLNASGKLRESPFEYTHPNCSVILFKSENYDNDKEGQWLKGLEVSGFLFEEINECQEQTIDIAFGRAGRWESDPRPKPIILATCNPAVNWVKTRVYDRWKDGTLPDDWLYIPSKVTDNPFLTQDYINNLKNMPKHRYMVLVEGEWDIQLKTGGEFYKCFEIDQHVGMTAYDPDLPIHMSWDDNVNPYLPVGLFQIHLIEDDRGKVIRKEAHAIDEIAGINPRNTVRAVCEEFKRKYPKHDAGLFVYGDATARKEDTKLEKGNDFYKIVQANLKDYKPTMRVSDSNPSVKGRGDWLNTVFEQEVGDLRVIIGTQCKRMIEDLNMIKEDENGGKLKDTERDPKTGKSYQKRGHFSDLFDYFMCRAFNSEYLKYKNPYSGSGQTKTGKALPARNSY